MRFLKFLFVGAVLSLACADETPRYQFQKDESGRLLRLDTRTGEVTSVAGNSSPPAAVAVEPKVDPLPESREKIGVVAEAPTQDAASEATDIPELIPSNADEILKRRCEKENGTDFRMLEYCIRMQREALAKLSVAPPGVPENAAEEVRRRCFNEYPDDFRMREYCHRMQFQAYEKLQQ